MGRIGELNKYITIFQVILTLVVSVVVVCVVYIDDLKFDSCGPLRAIVSDDKKISDISNEVGKLLLRENIVEEIGLAEYISSTKSSDLFDMLYLDWSDFGVASDLVIISFGCVNECSGKFDYFMFELGRNSILFLLDSSIDFEDLTKIDNSISPEHVIENLFLYCE